MNSKQISMIAIMSAVALGGNYVLSFVPNIEISTTIFFITSYILGMYGGLLCMLITSVLYSVFNPWGVFIPQIWISQVIGWIFTVIIGSSLSKKDHRYETYIICGIICTLMYDLITNLGFSSIFGLSYMQTLVFGLPFMIIHIISNTLLFSIILPIMSKVLKDVSIDNAPISEPYKNIIID